MAIKIKMKKSKLSDFLQSKWLKKTLLGLLLTFLLIGILDLSVFLYFKTNILAYTQKTGVLVHRCEIVDKLKQTPAYSTITLQQLLNDITVTKFVNAKAKEYNITVSQEEIEAKLKGTDEEVYKNNPDLIESTKTVILLEKLAKVKQPEISDKDIEKFYKENKELFKGKELKDVKDQIKSYLESQEINKQIVAWLDQEVEKDTFVDLTTNTLKYKPGAGLKLLPVCINHFKYM